MRGWLGWFALACVLYGCSTSMDLGSNDAGIPYDADCKPGVYTGTYLCMPTSGSSISFNSNGSLSVTLVPSGPTSLTLQPDASLTTAIVAGTTGTTPLSATLNCPTRQLVGKMPEVVFMSADFNAVVSGGGAFKARYDADASPPALVDGVMEPPPSLSSSCTWSAQLQ